MQMDTVPVPVLRTSLDAPPCSRLEEHVPEYELEIVKDGAFMYAFHEDAGDRID